MWCWPGYRGGGAVAQLEAYSFGEIDGLMLTGGLNPATIGAALQSQPGMTNRQQRLLNQVQEGASKQILPPALQTSGGP